MRRLQTNTYDKCDDFNNSNVSVLFFSNNIPFVFSYGVYISINTLRWCMFTIYGLHYQGFDPYTSFTVTITNGLTYSIYRCLNSYICFSHHHEWADLYDISVSQLLHKFYSHHHEWVDLYDISVSQLISTDFPDCFLFSIIKFQNGCEFT